MAKLKLLRLPLQPNQRDAENKVLHTELTKGEDKVYLISCIIMEFRQIESIKIQHDPFRWINWYISLKWY